MKSGTSNDLVFYELQRPSIISRIKDRQYSFFQKMLNLSEQDATITNIIRMCRRSNFIDYYFNLQPNNCNVYLTNLTEKIRNADSPMISYYRNTIKLEKSSLYHTFLNDYYRKVITRWRLSNHKLRIETGRYTRPKTPREDRKCNICNLLEDENHVIFFCPAYDEIRTKHQVLMTNNSINLILNPDFFLYMDFIS